MPIRNSIARSFHASPFLAVLIPFILGIKGYEYVPEGQFAYILSGLGASFLGYCISRLYPRQQMVIAGMAVFLGIFSFGLWVNHWHKLRLSSYTLPKLYEAPDAARHYPVFQGVVTDIQPRQKGIKAILAVEYLYDSLGQARRARGKVLLYVKDSLMHQTQIHQTQIHLGDRLLIASALAPITQFTYGFDYVSYLREQGIFFSLWLKDAHAIFRTKPRVETYWLQGLRQKISQFIALCMPTEASASFVKALFVGERTQLKEELKQAYQVSGIMHVMAISGLHIGTLFLFSSSLLSWLLWPIRRRVWARILKVSLLITLLCGYGFVVLGGPAIFRSVLMFSLIALSQLRQTRISGLNILFFSACLILCFQPQALHNVGFLLSYSAVLGLIVITPFTEQYTRKLPKLLAKPMLILLASSVAQLTTLPILLTVFAHFSSYFLFGNLLAIPLLAILMPMIVVMLILALIYLPLASWIGQLIHYLLLLLNKGIFYLASLPYAYIFTPHFGLWQSLSYYLVLGLLLACWMLRRRIYRGYAIYASVLWLGTLLWAKYQSFSQHRLYLHGHKFVEYIRGRKGSFWALQAGTKPDSSLLRTSWETHALNTIQFGDMQDYWYNSGVLVVNSMQEFRVLRNLELQVLILRHFSPAIFAELQRSISCQELVLLSPLRYSLLKQLSDYCEHKHIILHSAYSYQLLSWTLPPYTHTIMQ